MESAGRIQISANKIARNYFCTWRLGALKQALLASRDVIISSQFVAQICRGFFTLGAGCWLPMELSSFFFKGRGSKFLFGVVFLCSHPKTSQERNLSEGHRGVFAWSLRLLLAPSTYLFRRGFEALALPSVMLWIPFEQTIEAGYKQLKQVI